MAVTKKRTCTIAQAKPYASGFVVGRGKEYLSWRALPGVFCGDGDLLDDQNITPAELDAVLCEHSWLGEVDRLWDWSCSSGIECERTGRLIKPFRNFRLYVITDDARANPRLLMGLHDALWKLGRGRVIMSKAGLLDRAIFDMSVALPWHLDFVKPSLGSGLRRAPREAWIIRGKARRLVTEGKGLD
jgi:hypothetical protein